MALVVDSTPGAATANSFTSIAFADAYHESVLNSERWDDATEAEKAIALIEATRRLEANLQWIGRAATAEQALGWPRWSAYTRTGYLYDSAIVPIAVQEATAELARQLLEEFDAPADDNDLKSLKAGPVSLDFREVAAGEVAALPDSVYQMVKFLAARDAGPLGIKFVGIVRS